MRRDQTAVLHFISQVVRSLAGFGTTLLAARYFGAAGFGVYSQVLALLFWLKLPSNSLTSATSKRMSETNSGGGHFATGLAVALGYGVLAGAVIFLFDGLVNNYLNENAAHLLIVLLLANIAFDMIKSGFVGSQRVAISGWLGTFEQIGRLTTQLAFILSGAMVMGLVYGHIVSLAAFALLGVVLLRDRLALPSRRAAYELQTFAQYSWLSKLKGLTLSWMDILVLGLFVADDFVGIYTAAWTLASFLALASKSIGTTLFPELSELGSDKRYDRARELVEDGLMFAGVLLVPGLFGTAIIGDRVLEVYASEFAAGGTILMILVGARTLNEFGTQFLTALNGLDYPEIAFRINAVFLGTNLVLNLILVYLFDWYGAAIATFTSSAVLLIGAWVALVRVVGRISVPFRVIGSEILASAVMATSISLALPALPRTIPVTIGAVLAGAAVYSAVLVGVSGQIRSKVRRVVGV